MHSCSSPPPPPTSAQPELSVLHQIVDDYLEPLILFHQRRGHPLPPFVLTEFHRFLQCGDVNFGYASIECPNCGPVKYVPLSCKRRAWCPRCLRRRMIDRAAFLTHCVIGDTPVRHYAFTFPPPLRYHVPYDPALTTRLLGAFVHEVLSSLRWRAKRMLGLSSVHDAYPGAIASIHRASCNLDSNLHFHILGTDGVFVRDPNTGSVSFHELPAPTDEQVAEIAWRTALRTRDILTAHGLWRDLVDDPDDTTPNPAESTQPPARRLQGVLSFGSHSRDRNVTYTARATGRTDEDDGAYSFDLYARRAVAKGDRQNLERLAQYILHPPFTDRQLSRAPDGHVVLKPPRPRRDGTTHIVFDPLDFLNKLVPLIPRPRSHTLRLHGVWAPNASLRTHVLPKVGDPASTGTCSDSSDPSRRTTWAERILRQSGVDLRVCPHCSARTRTVICFPQRSGTNNILLRTGLGDDSRGPPPTPTADNRVRMSDLA